MNTITDSEHGKSLKDIESIIWTKLKENKGWMTYQDLMKATQSTLNEVDTGLLFLLARKKINSRIFNGILKFCIKPSTIGQRICPDCGHIHGNER